MDSSTTQIPQLPSFPLLLTSLLFFLMLVKYWKQSEGGKGKLPPGPKPLPIIGNLHQLSSHGLGLPHHAVTKFCNKYGPVMKLQLGQLVAVIISSPEAAKEVLKTNESSFAQRPEVYAVEVMSYDHSSIVFSPYNDYWRQLRKISVLELLSAKRVQSFKSIREDEVWDLVEFIASSERQCINLSKHIFAMTNNVVSRAAFGKKCKDQHDFTRLLQEIMQLAGGFDVADLFPSLTFLRSLTGMKPALLKAIIKETFRLHPPGPLIPREARETCEIRGYRVPAKAKILINVYAMGRDPTIWSDPESFYPERFEGSFIDFKGNHFELLPFGGGRRICPGISFATANIELGLAQMLYHFNWKPGNGIKLEDLDMGENFGMTARKKENLLVIATTHIPFRK